MRNPIDGFMQLSTAGIAGLRGYEQAVRWELESAARPLACGRHGDLVLLRQNSRESTNQKASDFPGDSVEIASQP